MRLRAQRSLSSHASRGSNTTNTKIAGGETPIERDHLRMCGITVERTSATSRDEGESCPGSGEGLDSGSSTAGNIVLADDDATVGRRD